MRRYQPAIILAAIIYACGILTGYFLFRCGKVPAPVPADVAQDLVQHGYVPMPSSSTPPAWVPLPPVGTKPAFAIVAKAPYTAPAPKVETPLSPILGGKLQGGPPEEKACPVPPPIPNWKLEPGNLAGVCSCRGVEGAPYWWAQVEQEVTAMTPAGEVKRVLPTRVEDLSAWVSSRVQAARGDRGLLLGVSTHGEAEAGFTWANQRGLGGYVLAGKDLSGADRGEWSGRAGFRWSWRK
jgi:hypothetical protein